MESMLAILVTASILTTIIAVIRDQVARKSDSYGDIPPRQRVASSAAIAFLLLMLTGVASGYEGQTSSAAAEATANIGLLAAAVYWFIVRRGSAARGREQRADAPAEH